MSAFKILVTLGFVGYFVLPLASQKYDEWWNGTQQEILEHSIAMEKQRDDETRAKNQERNQRVVGQNCTNVLESGGCSSPKNFEELESCVWSLRTHSCDSLPGVHLCAAVEEIPACGRRISQAITDRCDRLRDAANCQDKPAPEKKTHNWTISVPG